MTTITGMKNFIKNILEVHYFMSFGLCDINKTARCAYKSQPLSIRQEKEKSLAV